MCDTWHDRSPWSDWIAYVEMFMLATCFSSLNTQISAHEWENIRDGLLILTDKNVLHLNVGPCHWLAGWCV